MIELFQILEPLTNEVRNGSISTKLFSIIGLVGFGLVSDTLLSIKDRIEEFRSTYPEDEWNPILSDLDKKPEKKD